MKTYNLCILGFGNVGRALARLLQQKMTELRERYGIEYRVTGVATRRLGWLANPAGLDLAALLAGQAPVESGGDQPNDVRQWLTAAQADVLFELSSLNVQTGQPAITHLQAALEHGAHAITANKGPVVHAYRDLQALAQAHGKRFLFEATVMGGAPVFSLFQHSLPATKLLRFRGMPNATSTVILEEMEQGKSFEQAVKRAQDLGIAETDPSMDVDGWDAAVKICAIAQVLMGVPLKLDEIRRMGIRDLTVEQVQEASRAGTPYKLVSSLQRTGDGVLATVQPERVSADDPLAAVHGGSMLAHFELDVLPGLTVKLDVPDEGTVGPEVTAYDVLADFIRALGADR